MLFFIEIIYSWLKTEIGRGLVNPPGGEDIF